MNKEGQGVKLTGLEMDALAYAVRNHGRNFLAERAPYGDPHNAAIERLTGLGMFVDGGPCASGRWRVITPAGRKALVSPVTERVP